MHPDEKAIRGLVVRWHEATAAGDVETVLGLMAEDVVFLVAGHPPMRGRAAFEKALRAVLASHRIQSSVEVREAAVSGDLAYCWTEPRVEITPVGSNPVT